ncbi:hypothetical protein GCM10023322_10090 [Rugosimonospora acidiphila]|uniref:2TM domain-containing protein n=1 Tax=Rugosimonospora acidiphila TaxID=556531 RepID=A0ABP9RKM4_9ACTN
MLALIVGCEVAFWILLATALATRYVLPARKLGAVLLISVPLVDVVLVVASLVDLRRGGEASPSHGLAAIYLGVSVAFGRQMVSWAGQRFARRFAHGPAPTRPPLVGRDHASHERRQWLRHLLAYLIATGVLGLFTLLVGDIDRTVPMWAPMAPWAIALVIDFVISFSYTLAPRKTRG